MSIIWTIIIAIVVWFFLNRHKYGAHLYLTGDNIDSARLMGVNVDRTKMIAFAAVGLAAALAGLVQSAELKYYWPTLGDGYLLHTLASVFLGGTSVFGGAGTIFGTFLASFIIYAINPGIVAVGLTQYYTQVIYGFIIVAPVGAPLRMARRRPFSSSLLRRRPDDAYLLGPVEEVHHLLGDVLSAEPEYHSCQLFHSELQTQTALRPNGKRREGDEAM